MLQLEGRKGGGCWGAEQQGGAHLGPNQGVCS